MNNDITKWHKAVDDFVNGTIDKRNPVEMLSHSPPILELVGAKPLPIEITISTIRKVLERHDLPIETLKQVPQALADPIMVFDSATNDNLVFMLDLKDKIGATIVVPIALDKTSRKNYQVNEISSVYGRTKTLNMERTGGVREPHNAWFVEQIEKGNLKYIDHKKSQEWVKPGGLWLPTNFNRLDNMKIYTEADLVKLKDTKLQVMSEKTYLDVDFHDKDKVKALGAKWDWGKKLWYAPKGEDLKTFEQWIPKNEVQLSPQEEFAQKLKDFGFDLRELPIMDGTIQRVSLFDDKAGAKSGSYAGYADGRPAGWADNFKTGERITWTYSKGSKISQEDKEKFSDDYAKKNAEREAIRKAEQDVVAKNSLIQFEEALEAPAKHPYLVSKGIPPIGIYGSHENNTLLIAVYNIDGELRGLQKINEQGEKYFEKGMEKKSCFHVVGAKDGKFQENQMQGSDEIIICEGYATGVSLHLATGKPVFVAFDAGNLETVAKNLRERFPKASITICADNDHTKTRNTGVEKAKITAQMVGGTVKIPIFNQKELAQGLTDYNDLHRSRGLSSVKIQVSKKNQLNLGRSL